MLEALTKLFDLKTIFVFFLFILGWFLALGGEVTTNTLLSWFNLIFSLLLFILSLILIKLDLIHYYRLSMSCFFTMSFVFSILSIQEKFNLFEGSSANCAIAGFLFLSITQLYFIISFGSQLDHEKSIQFNPPNTIITNDHSIITIKDYLLKAKALYDYEANKEDPNELSFKKDEILEIAENRGKWWQAKTKEGKIGIVPSNYLQIL